MVFRIWAKMRIFLAMLFFMKIFAADATIDIIKQSQKIPTIFVNYIDNKYALQALRIYKVLLGDLSVSGHFIAKDGGRGGDEPDYATLEKNTDLFANLNVTQEENTIKVTLKLYDINSQKLVLNKAYVLDDSRLYPFVAHKIAIELNNYIMAPDISWMSRYVLFSAYIRPGVTNIFVGDYTLTYRKLIQSNGLNLFPKWANKDQSEIYYTKIIDNKAVIIRYNIFTGTFAKIIDSPGMAVVSSISKDYKKLLLALAPTGDPDIFLYDIDTKDTTKLTHYKGIDVSGNFVDDDKAMVFVSDRLGYPNIFHKKLQPNAPIEQVVYHGKNNSSVSSFQNYVVYSSRETNNIFGTNTFNLYLIATNSDFIRRLTTNGINQLPRFSSDGGSIMFVKTIKNQSALGVIRLDYNKTFLFPFKGAQIQGFDW